MPGRLGEAISQYERAIRLRPDFADAHNRLGLRLFKDALQACGRRRPIPGGD